MNRPMRFVTATIAFTGWAIAQNATGMIDGRVTDATNAAVPAAVVTSTHRTFRECLLLLSRRDTSHRACLLTGGKPGAV